MFGMWIGWVAAAVFGILVSAAMLSHELAQARFERGRVSKFNELSSPNYRQGSCFFSAFI